MNRIHRLRIQDFKGIDDLELSFPPPDLPGDPDVFVLGSRNGAGKTSVLEALSLGTWFRLYWTDANYGGGPGDGELDPFVRAGAKGFELAVQGSDSSDGWRVACELGKAPAHPGFQQRSEWLPYGTSFARDFRRLRGRDTNPLLLPGLLHFTGFRRLIDGDLSMQDLGGATAPGRSQRIQDRGCAGLDRNRRAI